MFKSKGGACSLSNKTIRNKSAVVERLQSSVNNRNIANKILASRPVRPKLDSNMGTFIGASLTLNKILHKHFSRRLRNFYHILQIMNLIKLIRY